MKSYEERREEQRRFEADVHYQVWRSGGNPDCINPDRLTDCYYDQHDADVCASRIVREQRARRLQSDQEQYPEDQESTQEETP